MSALSSLFDQAGPWGVVGSAFIGGTGIAFTWIRFFAWWHDRQLLMKRESEDRELFLLKEQVSLNQLRVRQMRREVAIYSRAEATEQRLKERRDALQDKIERAIEAARAAVEANDKELLVSKADEVDALKAEWDAVHIEFREHQAKVQEDLANIVES